MTKIYYNDDADIKYVEDKTIAIIGYGNQGRAQALNMRDSGCKNIIIGSVHPLEEDDGFEVYSIEDATKKADILFILIPDEVAPEVFENKIFPFINDGATINFSSAYNVTFKNVDIPKNLDVVMVAPRMVGEGVRDYYLSGEGFPAFLAVEQDYTGNAKNIALGLAKAIGSTIKGAIEVTFDDETYLDLMAEQAIWPIIYNVFMEAFKVELGYGHPEAAILTEMYISQEPEFMMRKSAEVGMFKQLPLHSRTSQYGQLASYGAFDPTPIREFIKNRYERIKSGEFNDEWQKELKDNELKNFYEMREGAYQNDLSLAEDRFRENLK